MRASERAPSERARVRASERAPSKRGYKRGEGGRQRQERRGRDGSNMGAHQSPGGRPPVRPTTRGMGRRKKHRVTTHKVRTAARCQPGPGSGEESAPEEDGDGGKTTFNARSGSPETRGWARHRHSQQAGTLLRTQAWHMSRAGGTPRASSAHLRQKQSATACRSYFSRSLKCQGLAGRG